MSKHVLWIAVACVSLAGCMSTTGPAGERPAPAGELVLTSAAGARFTGPAARIDIRHPEDGKPTVELVMSAVDGAGRTWALQAALPVEALDSLAIRAQLVQRSLQPGEATVQLSAPGASALAAGAGQLQARLNRGQLQGDVTGAGEEISATFAGPFAVTCAVPVAGGGGAPMLVVDEKFESPACKPFADLTQRTR